MRWTDAPVEPNQLATQDGALTDGHLAREGLERGRAAREEEDEVDAPAAHHRAGPSVREGCFHRNDASSERLGGMVRVRLDEVGHRRRVEGEGSCQGEPEPGRESGSRAPAAAPSASARAASVSAAERRGRAGASRRAAASSADRSSGLGSAAGSAP